MTKKRKRRITRKRRTYRHRQRDGQLKNNGDRECKKEGEERR